MSLGAKDFESAIAIVSIPNLRHRNSKVCATTIYLFEASVSVSDRQKIKGAGKTKVGDHLLKSFNRVRISSLLKGAEFLF